MESNQQTGPEKKTTEHLVSIKTEDVKVKPGEINDDSIGEQGHGDDYLGKSNVEED